MDTPTVSVLIPTYNYARFLPEALDSVLAQDFPSFEIFLGDDASTDDTAAVLQSYAARDPRLRYEINAANRGMVANWNYCLAQARAPYVKFLFGDDKLTDPGALGSLVKMLDKNPRATLAACARTVLDEKSHPVELWQTFADGLHNGRAVINRCLIEHANLIGEPSAVLFRKKDADRPFHSAYRQIVDLDLWFRLLEKGDLVYSREPWCGFRQHAAQQSARNDAAGVAWAEHLTFAAGYALRPWASRRAQFAVAYEFRRSAGRNRASLDASALAAQQSVAQRLGELWYRLYWIKHRLTRPWQNLSRSFRKRL